MKKLKLSAYQKYYYAFCRQCHSGNGYHKLDCSYQYATFKDIQPPSKPKSSLDRITNKIKKKHEEITNFERLLKVAKIH